MQLLSITDEKLEEYLGIWNKLIDKGHRNTLDITLTLDYKFPFPELWTLTYGEEKRELTLEQALKVKQWLESIVWSMSIPDIP
jgi:hypothetical protein